MLLTSQEAVRATQNNATLIHSPLDYAAFHNFGWGLDVRVRPRFVDATSKNDPANMTLENVMIRSNLVVSDAVCCTTNMNVKDINHFLAEVQKQDLKESSPNCLTLVHSLDIQLWGHTKELRGNDETLQSPFNGCTYLEVHQKLQDMVAATDSKLDTEWFLVLDESSAQTSTAVIVRVEDGDVLSARVAYPVSSRYLSAASIGHPPLDELIESANEEGDGVIRD